MASVNFPTNIGGDGSTVTDDSNATTGLANGGFRTRLLPMFTNIVNIATWLIAQVTSAGNSASAAISSASAAAASAATAIGAPGTSGTSTTSLTIGTGSQSLTVQSGKLFALGMYVTIASTASPVNLMSGTVTAYNQSTGAMTVNVTNSYGNGSVFAAWTVAISGAPAASSPFPYIYVQDQKTVNTTAGNSVSGNQTRTLNAVVQNTITGASLAGNAITLPAGTYRVRGSVPFWSSGGTQAWIQSAAGTALVQGTSDNSQVNASGRNAIVGTFTLSAATTVTVIQRTTTAATNGLGQISGNPTGEVYTELEISKVA